MIADDYTVLSEFPISMFFKKRDFMEKETVVKCKQENCDKVKHGYRNNSVFFCLSNLLRLPGIFWGVQLP